MDGRTSRSRAVSQSASHPTYLYRCYDATGLLLYVGCSENPGNRARDHRSGQGSPASILLSRYMDTFVVDSDAYANRDRGRRAEAEAIRTEQPLFNVQERCIPRSFVQGQIADYIAGRPIRQWGTVNTPARWAA